MADDGEPTGPGDDGASSEGMDGRSDQLGEESDRPDEPDETDASPPPDAPGRTSYRWRRALAAAAVVVLLGAMGLSKLWIFDGDDTGDAESEVFFEVDEDQAEVGHVLSRFVRAQRDGDCDALIEVVAEESWSDGGQRSRAEFLEQCAEAIGDGFTPDLDHVRIDLGDNELDGEQRKAATVTPTSSWTGLAPFVTYGDGRAPEGRLVREDRDWKVTLDDAVFPVGPRVDQVVTSHLAAYNDGDCAGMFDHLTEAAWSSDGVESRDDFVGSCNEAMDRRDDAPRSSLHANEMDVTLDPDGDRAEVVVTPGHLGILYYETESAPDESDAPASTYGESVALVRDGLSWKLDGDPQAAPAAVPGGALPQAMAHLELRALLSPETEVDGEPCFNYLDEPAHDRYEVGFEVGLERDFNRCHTNLSVMRFADAEAAATAAGELRDGILADASDSDHYDPGREAELPGLPDAYGVETSCGDDGCGAAEGVMASGDLVVHVASTGDLADVAAVLTTQLERL